MPGGAARRANRYTSRASAGQSSAADLRDVRGSSPHRSRVDHGCATSAMTASRPPITVGSAPQGVTGAHWGLLHSGPGDRSAAESMRRHTSCTVGIAIRGDEFRESGQEPRRRGQRARGRPPTTRTWRRAPAEARRRSGRRAGAGDRSQRTAAPVDTTTGRDSGSRCGGPRPGEAGARSRRGARPPGGTAPENRREPRPQACPPCSWSNDRTGPLPSYSTRSSIATSLLRRPIGHGRRDDRDLFDAGGAFVAACRRRARVRSGSIDAQRRAGAAPGPPTGDRRR